MARTEDGVVVAALGLEAELGEGALRAAAWREVASKVEKATKVAIVAVVRMARAAALAQEAGGRAAVTSCWTRRSRCHMRKIAT